MMSSEPQPRRTAEKRRFSSTAVQAIHQRRRWAVARVGAMARRGEARRGGLAPARAPALQPPAHRPRRQRPALCSRVGQPGPLPQRVELVTPLRPGRQVRAARKPQPCPCPGPPSPPLARPPARSSRRAAPARQGDFSLGSLGGKLRHGNKKGLTPAQGRGLSPGSQKD